MFPASHSLEKALNYVQTEVMILVSILHRRPQLCICKLALYSGGNNKIEVGMTQC